MRGDARRRPATPPLGRAAGRARHRRDSPVRRLHHPSASGPRGQALQGCPGWLACGRAGRWHGLTSDSLSHLARPLWGDDFLKTSAGFSGSCVWKRLRSGFPMRGALSTGLFSSHCCAGQGSSSSFHFIKSASAPPPAS